MKFSELEKIMSEKGVYTLAEIARSLSTTPQAVSNWKGRDQVPYHVEAKLQSTTQPTIKIESNDFVKNDVNDNISISDILLVFSQQIKLILLIPFILVFTTFTYVMFIQKPLYTCEAKILLPSSQNTVSGGLAGLASQFGVSVPTTIQTDLSNPSMIPELLKSRTFAEKILEIEFFSEKFQKILPLISILLEVDQKSEFLLENIGNKSSAISIFTSMIEFEKSTTSPFNYIRITSDNAKLSRAILSVTVKELEEFNKFYRNKSVLEKIAFINNRIMSVKSDLEKSEQELKQFREQNRQISS